MKNIIVGTAGHIDHGKTSLVKALTGVDADRLKEEKQRGITIDIGFANLATDDCRFGFVDVPGHERFIKNMLAGAHGLDLVMLVIAADEGVMPQTREHLDICRLLKIPTGFTVLTKADLVESDWLELVSGDVEEFLEGSFLEGKPIVPVSVRTGDGLADVLKALTDAAAGAAEKNTGLPPRLPVDRVFTVRGFGTVVTGTMIAGQFRVGDEVEILPAGHRTRIRGIEAHGSTQDAAVAGQRTALNLAGLEISDIERGQVVVPAGRFEATSMLDVRLELLASAQKPLRDRARVRLHHGTSEVMARAALLGGRDQLAPGESAFVQLRLETPVLALPGDRFIIRSYSPQTTIAGGAVLDAHPGRHRRSDQRILEFLPALESSNPSERIAAFLQRADQPGATFADLAMFTGESDAEIETCVEGLKKAGQAVVLEAVSPKRVIRRTAFTTVQERIKSFLHKFHQREPMRPGAPREEVREHLGSRLPVEVFRAAVEAAVAEKRVTADGEVLRLASFRPEAAGEAAALKAKIEAAVKNAGLVAPTAVELYDALKVKEAQAKPVLFLLINEKKIARAGDFLLHADVIEKLVSDLRALKPTNPMLDVALFKDKFGLSRKYAIPILEYLDGERVTRRVGNAREIL